MIDTHQPHGSDATPLSCLWARCGEERQARTAAAPLLTAAPRVALHARGAGHVPLQLPALILSTGGAPAATPHTNVMTMLAGYLCSCPCWSQKKGVLSACLSCMIAPLLGCSGHAESDHSSHSWAHLSAMTMLVVSLPLSSALASCSSSAIILSTTCFSRP